MRKSCVPILIAILLFTVHSTWAQSNAGRDRNVILTEGTAEVTGQNDSTRISIAVITSGKDLERVGSENAEKTKRVIKAIKALEIKGLDLKTSDYRVIPQRDYKARPPGIIGYEVQNSVVISLEGFEQDRLSGYVSKVIGSALGNGANSIQSLQSYIKDKKPLEKEALIQAVQEARDRADILAGAAGVKIKRIISISTQPIIAPPVPNVLRAAAMKAEDASMAPPIEIGVSQVRVHVNMAFEIQ
jgi:uncharacterized protein YggE